MNVCSLVGAVLRSPTVRFEGDGHQSTSFTLAVQERSYGPERKEYQMFIPMTAYGKAAEACEGLRRADLIAVSGKLSWQKRVGKCKTEHSVLCVRVSDVQVLSPGLPAVPTLSGSCNEVVHQKTGCTMAPVFAPGRR